MDRHIFASAPVREGARDVIDNQSLLTSTVESDATS